MRFLLSIHDVWPGNVPLVSGYLARLRSLGAARVALLVVPAYHGRATMEADPEFLAWLRDEQGRGSELFLHGYHHKMVESVPGSPMSGGIPPAEGESGSVASPGRNRRNAWGRFVNRRLVDQEAEFCGLPEADSERLLDLGLASWTRTGLPMTGFVAPTWHGSPAVRHLRDRQLGLWETRFHVQRLADGETRFAPPLAWDLSAPDGEPRLVGGNLWRKFATSLPLMKVAIHPGDFEGKGTEAVLRRVFAAGTSIAYADIFSPSAAARPVAAVPG